VAPARRRHGHLGARPRFGLNLSLGACSRHPSARLAAAAAAAVYLLLVSDRIGTLKALGLSLLLFVVLGRSSALVPDVGLILLAPTPRARSAT